MDSSHVSLISLELSADGFEPFRCDKNITLGMNHSTYAYLHCCMYYFISSFFRLSSTLKCASSDDTITMRAKEDTDSISYIFESPSEGWHTPPAKFLSFLPDGDKTSQYDIRLMDIDSEHLGIPVCFRDIIVLQCFANAIYRMKSMVLLLKCHQLNSSAFVVICLNLVTQCRLHALRYILATHYRKLLLW